MYEVIQTMRPTPGKQQIQNLDENGTSLVLDPGMSSKLLSNHEAEVWLEFAAAALRGFAGSSDITANNPPSFITDEACLMADRMLLAYRFRVVEHSENKK